MKKAKFIFSAALSAVLGLPCLGQSALQGLPMFTVSKIPSPNGQSFYLTWISDDGNTMSGSVYDSNVKDPIFHLPIGQCFISQNGTATFYPTPGFSCGIGLGRSANTKGQFGGVVQDVGTGNQTAFVVLDGSFDMVGARLPGVALNQIPQCAPHCAVARSYVTGMNESGDAVGVVEGFNSLIDTPDNPNQVVQYGWLYSKGQLTVLPLAWASGINDRGDIAGLITMPDGSQHAAIYSNGTVTDLGTFGPGGNSLVGAINSLGHVGGYSTFQAFDVTNPTFSLRWAAYLYDGTTMNRIAVPMAGEGSNVNWLNDNDEVVGQYVGSDPQSQYVGYYYANGLAADINSLVVNPPPDVTLTVPGYITNNGQILVNTQAGDGGLYGTPVLLIPVTGSSSTDDSTVRRREHSRR